MKKNVIIIGAAGRDFHNFNTYYRGNEDYNVVAFTAAQIPDIDGRKYPTELAGDLYPDGIPIYAEEDLPKLIKDLKVDDCTFSYSDVPYQRAMAMSAIVNAAGATIPFFSVILRKGYGLGAMAMVGGGYHRPVFNISWPTGEFGGMGLEGAVRLGFKKELDAAEDPKEKKTLFDSLVKMAYDHGKAINMASFLEIDDVIDPKDTRRWIMRGKLSLPPVVPRTGKKRPNIDTW